MKTLFLMLFLVVSLSAHHDPIRNKIVSTIIENLDTKSQKIVYSDDKDLLQSLSATYKVTDKCLDANLLILNSWAELDKGCKNKNIFVLNYNLLYDVPQSFGAFFFQKGRANIVLLKDKLKKQDISISKQLEPYVEDRLW